MHIVDTNHIVCGPCGCCATSIATHKPPLRDKVMNFIWKPCYCGSKA